jgi:single-stranded DNA-binding protein
MSNETTITIAGNLVDDPELRFTPVPVGSGLLGSR